MIPEGIRFANRFDKVTGSAIREIFKVLGKPGMISFAGGNPANDALPDKLCAQLASDALLADGKRILQYGATEGYPPFVESLIEYAQNHLGIAADKESIVPTTGSTSCMDLLCKAMLDPGDVVLVESPTFLGNMQTLKLYQAKLVSVPSDDNGIITEELEKAAKQYHPKMLYIIPTFQNPTGRTLSAERRPIVAELAEKYQFLVMEDDPYRDLRYSGESLPTIKSYDKDGYVAFLGSFSKVISPGLRVGYLAAQKDILRKCVIGKQGTDLHTPNLCQAVVDQFLRRNLLAPHIQEIIPSYREKMNRMIAKCAAFPEGTHITTPEGGLFLFCELPERINATELFPKAVEAGVAYVPGTFFYPDGGHDNTIRFNFSNSTLDQIDAGMDKLAELLRNV